MPRLRSEKAAKLLSEAKRHVSIADNMFTYAASVTDSFKVYISCISHLKEAAILMAKAALENEAYFKRILFIPTNEKLLLKTFLDRFDEKLGISLLDKKHLKEINYIYETYKSRETGMKRGDSYIVISANFDIVSLDRSQIKNYLMTMKSLATKLEDWLRDQYLE